MGKYRFKSTFTESRIVVPLMNVPKIRGITFCGDCKDFPCDNLHPYADKAETLPHNIKVYNLCLINKIGLEKWAESKALEVRKTYFTKPWDAGTNHGAIM